MSLTDNPDSACLRKPPRADGQNECYLVLSEDERAKGFVRPLRHTYVHDKGCGAVTSMATPIAETYARDPSFYGRTFCAQCHAHLPVGEFVWDGTEERVGT